MFSELNHPARQPSVYASLPSLAGSQARLEARMESLLLSCGALSSPTMCRFIPALSDPSASPCGGVFRDGSDLTGRTAGEQHCDLLRHLGGQFCILFSPQLGPAHSRRRPLIGVLHAFLLRF